MTSALLNLMDKRKHPRTCCSIPAHILTKCGDVSVRLEGRIINHSSGGYGFVQEASYSILADIEARMIRKYKCRRNETVDLVVNGVKQNVQVRWCDSEKIGLMALS